MQVGQGNLVIIDGAKVFWKGQPVPGVIGIKLNHEEGDTQVKLKVNGTADALYMEMVTAGIIVKKEKTK